MKSRLVVDLHTHSRFAIGCSKFLTLETLGKAARTKGIDFLSTGDFTHPAWFKELKAELTESAAGVYSGPDGGLFILGAEIACVWRTGSRGRRVHVLLLAPNLSAVEGFNRRLGAYARLESDGRPITSLSAESLAHLAWEADENFVVIPAHIWTPWYGMYGSKSGVDSVEECFGKAAPRVQAVETGLSSDPAMNWRVSDLDGRSIVSFSDAHSPEKLGRELTVLQAAPTYASIRSALLTGRILETIEFFPEHGKYHLDGHTKCGVRLYPAESAGTDGRCKKCRRPLTLGVVNRNEKLSDRPEEAVRLIDGLVHGPAGRPPYRRLVPLAELVAWAHGVGSGALRVRRTCGDLVQEFGDELTVLRDASGDDLARVAGEEISGAIVAVREGRVQIDPGYDGTYGKVTPVIGQVLGSRSQVSGREPSS